MAGGGGFGPGGPELDREVASMRAAGEEARRAAIRQRFNNPKPHKAPEAPAKRPFPWSALATAVVVIIVVMAIVKGVL